MVYNIAGTVITGLRAFKGGTAVIFFSSNLQLWPVNKRMCKMGFYEGVARNLVHDFCCLLYQWGTSTEATISPSQRILRGRSVLRESALRNPPWKRGGLPD